MYLGIVQGFCIPLSVMLIWYLGVYLLTYYMPEGHKVIVR